MQIEEVYRVTHITVSKNPISKRIEAYVTVRRKTGDAFQFTLTEREAAGLTIGSKVVRTLAYEENHAN